jgi:hypothetical protein
LVIDKKFFDLFDPNSVGKFTPAAESYSLGCG